MIYFLQANPSIGKDQPPDLAAFVPSDATVLQEGPEKVAPLQGPDSSKISVNKKSPAVAGM